MSALNVSFTDDELDQLREVARREGVSLKTFVHDSTVAAATSKKHLIAQLAGDIAVKSSELNRRLA